MFSLSKLRLDSVRDYCEYWINPSTEIQTLWKHQPRSWELEEVIKLNDLIVEVFFSTGDDDVVWRPSRKKYETADGRKVLRTLSLGNQVGVQWEIEHYLKFEDLSKNPNFLMENGTWSVTNQNVLIHKIRFFGDGIYCKMCGLCIEDQNHIFWEYFLAKDLWKRVFEWWGVNHMFSHFMHFNIGSWLNWFQVNSVKMGGALR